jgi:hypothetical protein
MIVFHQRQPDALRRPALDLAFNQQRVDCLAHIVRRRQPVELHRAEPHVSTVSSIM